MIKKIITAAGITGLTAIVLSGCKTNEAAIENMTTYPVKTPEQVTEDWREEKNNLKENTLEQGKTCDEEFLQEYEKVKQGKTQSYERLMGLYDQLEEKQKQAYKAKMDSINRERETIQKAYEKANKDLQKEKESAMNQGQ